MQYEDPPPMLQMLDRLFPPDRAARLTDAQATQREVAQASETMGGYLRELGPGAAHMTVLDFGCGWGGETLWLAGKVREAHGVDIEANSIAQANKALGESGVRNCVFAVAPGGRLPYADKTFDAVLSTDTFEHVMDLEQAFREIHRVLKPGGILISKWGPLFYSPHGYHLYWACKVPWAHTLFGLKAIGIMRSMRGGSDTQPQSWQDLGLNAKRFDDYKSAVKRSGLKIVRFDPIAVRGLNWITHIPLVRDFMIFGIDCHVRRSRSDV